MKPVYSSIWALVFVAGINLGQPVRATDTGVAVPESVEQFRSAVKALRAAEARQSLAPIYAQALQVQDELMAISDDFALIEKLTEKDYSSLQQTLPGFVLNRQIDIFAHPDPGFFVELANDHGEAADQAFFSLLNRSTTAEMLPVFIKPEGRGVCLKYGDGLIAPYYADWLSFQGAFPGHYEQQVSTALADVEEAIGLGTCACGEKQSVEQELKGFLRAFPNPAMSEKIKARLHQLDTDPHRLPVNCT